MIEFFARNVIPCVRFVQAFARGVFGRERFISMRANAKAVIIQRHVRGWLARIRYRKVRHGFIMLQAHVRRHAAKKELKKLKVSSSECQCSVFSRECGLSSSITLSIVDPSLCL